MVQAALGDLTVDLADSPTTQVSGAPSIESIFGEVLADVLGVERVSVDSNFFDDLGADSMVMARFCARVRKRPELPAVSMKDIYQHPTITSLVTALGDTAPVAVEPPAPISVEVPKRAGTLQVAVCGALQLLIFLTYSYLAALVIAQGYEWISAGTGVLDIYLRSVIAGCALFLFLFTVPILAKWILIGRWKPRQIRIWSLAYLRFWIVKTLVRRNPIVLFTGSPLFTLYLRALGAKVGRGVVIFSTHVPICTDLLTIGDGTVIRKDSFINGYRAHAGFIQVGPITIGKNAVISEATVIDIDTSMGDGTQLGHASSLHSWQTVPDGQRWHGTPAQQTSTDNFLTVLPARCGTLRRAAYAIWQLLTLLLVYLPLGIGGAILLLLKVPRLNELMAEGAGAVTGWMFYRDALAVSFVLFFGSILAGFVIVTTVPRLLNLAIRPDKVYRLYGFHYGVHRWIVRLTNAKFLSNLVGDSSWIVYYLRGIGYDLGNIVQTGANFGGNVKHESPYLSSIGSATMVADALSMMNAEFSTTTFRLSETSIGERNFLGNGIAYPPRSKTGDNCLLATKVMVPISGRVWENVGLLGSPPFEIPRSVERDSSFDHLKQGDGFSRGLAAKNRHNFVTIVWCLFARWMFVFLLTVLLGIAGDLYASLGAAVIALDLVLSSVFGVAYWILVDRIVTGFKPLPVLFCSIYEPAMWRHERYWKVPSTGYLAAFAGTPFINMILRGLGARVGRRVFNDGCGITERSLVSIGDDCTLNEMSAVQCHSQEDGTFKSDYSTLGRNVTLGTGSHVHYGVTIGDGAELTPDCFLMKGEQVPAGARWGGNPAREIRDRQLVAVRTNRPSSQSPTPGPHPSDSTPQPLWWDQEPEGDAETPAPVFAPRDPDVVVSTDRPSSESPTPGPHPSDSTPQPLWWDQEPGSVAEAPEKRLAEGPAELPPVDRNLSDFRRAVRLFRRFGGSRKVYLVGVLLLTFEALTSVIEPFPIAYLIDFLQGARPSLRDLGWPSLVPSELVETLLLLTIAIVGIAAVNSAADSLTEVCMARGGRSLGYNIRVAMYSHLQRLSLSYHDKKRTGDVLTRVTGDVLVVEEFVVGSISNILGSLLVLVGSLSLLFYRSWKVALVAMVVCPLLALVSNFYSRRIKTASKTQRSREGELASTAQEMLTSIRLVQSYGRGRVDLEQFSSQTEKSMRASLGAANIQAQFSFVVSLMEALAICAVVWLGVGLVEGSAITIGTLVLFILLLQNMFKPARKIVSEWYKIGKVFASVDRIDDLLDREAAAQDEPDAVAAPTLTGALKFDHVSFAYPAEHEDGSEADQRPKVLHDIDFEVAAGEVVSLVGSSGAGKSTIAQLVPRLYDPDEGAVLVDGMDVHGLTLTSLRSQVSLVLQDTVLLNGSAAENIGYGIADATPERIEAAARMANAHAFITAMPDGYDTQLGERGAMLSGGQRQRIAIARAFIRETPILILDEPTTGLDLESTQLVLTALRSLMRGKTTIIISHDLGLIRCADRILVIADGRIAESGEHRELMSARGLYAELYESEFDGENPHASGNGSGSSEEGRYGDNSDYVTVAPRQAEPVTRPAKRDGVRSIRPGARWRMTP